MSETLCRLCFMEKPKRISIFGGKGSQQKIAETIRTHFSDEVRGNATDPPQQYPDPVRVTA